MMTPPFVSVIVPVYNDAQRIATCVEALLSQTYPRERYEILIVDNGSTDATRSVVQRYDVTLLVEDRIQSSYAARNKGIQHARGTIIAFTDSDCTPVPTWIEAGVRALQDEHADLAGGNVRFVYSSRPTGAEIYDSLTNMQMEQNIRERSVAKTANLFVVTTAFDRIGMFPDNVRSGGDVIWTSRATAQGLRLVYTPQAEVAHPTRRLSALLRKQYRVGRGQRAMRATSRVGEPQRIARAKSGGADRKALVPKGLLPPSPLALHRSLGRRHVTMSMVQFGRIWAAAWLAQLATTFGRALPPRQQRKAKQAQPVSSGQIKPAGECRPQVPVRSDDPVQLSDIIVQMSAVAMATQAADGSFPAGHNGPYHDLETPVRNTAHWLVTLLKAYEITGDVHFSDAARQAAEYLISPAVRPMGATFFCRKNPEKDFCNGLIGQAWAIEGLIAAADSFGEPRYRMLAAEVFQLHPFDNKTGLWRIVNVDGSNGPFDPTFNHQLLFAAAGAMIDSNPQSPIGAQVRRFLDCVHSNHLRVSHSGRIVHYIPAPDKWDRVPHTVRPWLQSLRELRVNPYMLHKEIGYHAFNLYAFALLKRSVLDHALWCDDKFQALLNYVAEEEYLRGLENNKYGYPYNPPGFEVALAMQAFSEAFSSSPRPAHWWVEQQFRCCYDRETMLLSKRTEDPLTLTARIYEATRLQDMRVVLGGLSVTQVL
jgi:Glycosyl transferase family 2